MHRTLGIALSATMLLAACKIERTPRQFYSQRDPAAAERELFAAELTDRVAAMGPALDRGDLGAAVFALSPAPDGRGTLARLEPVLRGFDNEDEQRQAEVMRRSFAGQGETFLAGIASASEI